MTIWKKTLTSSVKSEKIKNIEYSTNNWIRDVETFHANNNYGRKLEEISDIKVLDSQLAQYFGNETANSGASR